MKSIKKANLKNKKVIVRCDFNVPLSKKGAVLDDYKIKSELLTIKYLISQKAKVILISHLGRPEKRENKYSLKPVASCLENLLGSKVFFSPECIGEKAKKAVSSLKSGQVILLENLRFHKEEEENKESFAKELAKLAHIYVNDAFAVSHRDHASITGISNILPSFAGFLLLKEVRILRKITKNPKKPLVAIIGGAKVETKAALINKLSESADFVLIGGLISREMKEKDIYLNYPRKIISPLDEIEGKDIGEKTVSLFKEKILKANTIFFNGVLGQIENQKYRKGTEEILKAIIESNAYSVVGGGETVEFVNSLSLASKFNHLSTGGGAMISFLAGEVLPGIKALDKWK